MAWKPRCYVASPLGFSEAGRFYSEQVLLPSLEPVVEVLDPWSLMATEELTRIDWDEEQRTSEIGRRNSEAIASSALLVAVLDGQELDSGTAAEVGYASALGLTCFGLRTDLRQTGEAGATVNLQVEAFIQRSGGRIVGDLPGLLEALAASVDRLRLETSHPVSIK